MSKIELLNDYYIEQNEKGFILYRKRISHSRDGSEKEVKKSYGYFTELRSAMERFVFLNQDRNVQNMSVFFYDYVRRIEESNEKAVNTLVENWRLLNG